MQIEKLKKKYPRLRVPVINGGLKLVYDPAPDQPWLWGINDHSLIQDRAGKIHFFGIENPNPTTKQALTMEKVWVQLEPTDRPWQQTLHQMMWNAIYFREYHYLLGHAVADSIWGPWTQLPPVFDGSTNPDELYPYGSPFVFEANGTYWMFVPEGWCTKSGPTKTSIFTSTDLTTWKPVEEGTAWNERSVFGTFSHRDPCILKLDDGTFLQYFAAGHPEDYLHIGVASSRDLKFWQAQESCYIEDDRGIRIRGGGFESPFVYRKDGLFYLFVGWSHRHYYETFVVVSDNPYHFPVENKITTLFTHAAELIDIDGTTYMSSCGLEDPQEAGQSGLWMCELSWM